MTVFLFAISVHINFTIDKTDMHLKARLYDVSLTV